MSWAKLIIDTAMLERMLHLDDHGIRIRDACVELRFGHPVVALRLAGEGLPDCEVIAELTSYPDGREVLSNLRPVT